MFIAQSDSLAINARISKGAANNLFHLNISIVQIMTIASLLLGSGVSMPLLLSGKLEST